jgi:hypothetical protein
MTDQIEQWAREAGLVQYATPWCSEQTDGVDTEDLARFAALVAAHEREQCALVCEALVSADRYAYADECAQAIRTRTSASGG